MIINTEEYQSFVESIMYKCGVLRTSTMINCLMNTYETIQSINDAIYVLQVIQDFSEVMLSDDGYIITKGCYLRIVDDPYFLNIRYGQQINKVPSGIIHITQASDKAMIECMPIIADMMPESLDFLVTEFPWKLQFISRETKRLYQVCRISNIEEIPISILLNSLPELSDADYKNHIRRIAIIDDKSHAYLIPKIGFSVICTYAPNNIQKEFEIVQKREKNAWDDYNRIKKELEI